MKGFLYIVEAVGLTLLAGVFVWAGVKTWWMKKSDEERAVFIAGLRRLVLFQDAEEEVQE